MVIYSSPQYSPQGIAIAADGREKRNGKRVTDSRRKIFSFDSGAHTVLAYALTGCAQDVDDDRRNYDLDRAVADALQTAIPAGQNVATYLGQIGEAMRDHLASAKHTGAIAEYPQCDQSGLIATLVVGGFYEKYPFTALVSLWHKEQELEPPRFEIRRAPGIEEKPMLLGPRKILDAICDPTPNPLSKYRKTALGKLLRREPISLPDAVMAAEKYIEAVMHPYSLNELDPRCSEVGGHIHSATITLSDGFKWGKPPLQAQPTT